VIPEYLEQRTRLVASGVDLEFEPSDRIVAPILIGARAGFLIGGALDLGSQLIRNGFDWNCVDLASAGWAGFEGAAWGV
jgi:hypothetical protein